MPHRERFGRVLRGLREQAGLTQSQLANRLGYDHSYLSKIESGVRVPPLELAGRADNLLNAGGTLLAAATSVRAARRSPDAAPAALTIPLPCAPPREDETNPPVARLVRLPAFGVTCPTHGSEGCTAISPATGLAGILTDTARALTVGVETVHAFAALLTTYIESSLRGATIEVTPPVERAMHVLMGVVAKANGATAVGLLQLAARYADLAGSLRAERGQHAIATMWLQRSVELGRASGNLPVIFESLTRMSALAWQEGDGTTGLAYSRAAAGLDVRRRWMAVEAKLHDARSHAVLGDHREFERQSNEAQRAAERLGDRDRLEAPWLVDATGDALIASHLAGALRDLVAVTGQRATAARAVTAAETSLANVPAWMYRSRLMLTLRLADTHACGGDVDAAIAIARPVIAAATAAGTAPIRQEMHGLRSRLGRRFSESF